MNHDNPSFHHRKQIVQYALQMNPKNVGGKDGGSASAGESMSASSASPYRRFENNENSAQRRLENGSDGLIQSNFENQEQVGTKLERSKIIWILHNIKKSVHGIIYYGDLSQKG